eukprot:1050475-Prymnesium_polylepis.2
MSGLPARLDRRTLRGPWVIMGRKAGCTTGLSRAPKSPPHSGRSGAVPLPRFMQAHTAQIYRARPCGATSCSSRASAARRR